MDNMKLWNNVKQPPKDALKQIKGGRLNGKTDINPQWRYQAMTEQFGPCGVGWKYEIVKLWNEPGSEGQIFAFALVNVSTATATGWSDPIPGIGGSMLVEKEKAGLHSSDEGYKMAVTDALSVALKMLGVAADIYAGRWDGAKYREQPEPEKTGPITADQAIEISDLLAQTNSDLDKFLKFVKADSIEAIPESMYQTAVAALRRKANGNN